MKEKTLKDMVDCGIVSVIRGDDISKIMKVVEAILSGGIRVIEITFTVKEASKIIESLSKIKEIIVGAGTVLDKDKAEAAISKGAQFIVSPALDLEVIKVCRRHETIICPGAFSPTEIITAWKAGADIIKISPISFLGHGYLKALKGPFPQIPFMPTGGIDLNNASAYIKEGAALLGVGGGLIDKKAMGEGRYEVITAKAKEFIQVIKNSREK